jgi:hypothetical protein
MSQSRLTSGEPTNARRERENSPKPSSHRNQTHPTKQKPGPPTNQNQNHEGGGQKHQPGQRTTRRADKTNQSEGAGGRRQAETSKQGRADAREGSRGRRENAAQAKVGAYSFSGVLRGFWITRGRIPQCRSEGHMNNTHSMVERAKPHTGPKPLLP